VGREGVGLVLSVLCGDSFTLDDVSTCWEEKLIGQVRFCRPYVFKVLFSLSLSLSFSSYLLSLLFFFSLSLSLFTFKS